MTPTADAHSAVNQFEKLKQFDGFPYLTTRLVPALYHIALLPADAPESTLLKLAQVQAHANQLDTCLSLAANRATFFSVDGRVTPSHEAPRGGALLSNRLALPVDLLQTDELSWRQSRLDRLIAEGPQGTMFGDLSKGGRRATGEELRRLLGQGPDGAPRGLERCQHCGDWCGECLDTNETFAGMVMTVHCRCMNHNRCARCGILLYDWRLNANYYDPHDRGIWHVPGFCGLRHQCDAHGRLAIL